MNSKIRKASSSENLMSSVWTRLWKLKIPVEVKHFCWKVIKEFLPMNINLQRREIDTTVCSTVPYVFGGY